MTRMKREAKVLEMFRRAGGVLRTGQVLGAGIHPRDLYALRDGGILDAVSRGVYRLADLPPLAEPDLATVAARIPKAVVAVVSALHFHGLTTEVPHAVSIALPKGTSRPRLEWPPLRVHWFSGAMYAEGIETHERDGVRLKVYGAAKTVADCFRLRNRLGIEVAVEALRTGLEERRFTPAQFLSVAGTCRVARVVRPYLEALL
ncbi:MAG: type IV toxin-antitoxin system AbiEi family antitoxin domain-containing protein [Planctomycetes bacterium]|nr:type IV toxin-antitoxin system AbiEi family antitoxin domain-containing protein [Planctomycetota bacterium]